MKVTYALMIKTSFGRWDRVTVGTEEHCLKSKGRRRGVIIPDDCVRRFYHVLGLKRAIFKIKKMSGGDLSLHQPTVEAILKLLDRDQIRYKEE